MPDLNDNIQSPEQLDNYIRVTSSGAWLVLSAIIIVLMGFMFWIFAGEIDTQNGETVRPVSFLLK